MIPSKSYVVQGFSNPVTAALKLAESLECAVDKPSFERVAAVVGDVESSDGFMVEVAVDAFDRLGKIGGFVIAHLGGQIVAMLPGEFEKWTA